MHLQKALAIRFPIFILITKSDRILGFSEFFRQIDPEYHSQIFGWSNPEENERWDPGTLPELLGEIALRAHKLRLRLLSKVRDTGSGGSHARLPGRAGGARGAPSTTTCSPSFARAASRSRSSFAASISPAASRKGAPSPVPAAICLRVQVGDPQGVLENLETVFTRQYAFFIRDFYEKKVFPRRA